MKTILVILSVMALAVTAWAGDINHLTPAEYEKFCQDANRELKNNPEKITAAAKEYMMRSNGLKKDDSILTLFDGHPEFAVKTMVFMVALNNKFHQDKGFTDDYTIQARTVARDLKDSDLIFMLGFATDNFLERNKQIVGH